MKRVILALTVTSFACSGPSPMDGGTAGGGRAGGSAATGGGSAGGSGTGGSGGGGRAGGAGTAGGAMLPSPDGGWCGLPGSWVHDTDGGYHEVGLEDGGRYPYPPDSGLASLNWLKLPPGFCVHQFANVGNSRQIRFAPGGELFAASPTAAATSTGTNGRAAIVVMPDDDRDGFADSVTNYRSGLGSTQGLMFFDGGFFFQNGTFIMSEPYAPGQRAPTGNPTPRLNIIVLIDSNHWPKTLDHDDTGRIFVTNGSNQGEQCITSRPFKGGIVEMDGTDGGRQVAKGLRNAIYLRCHHDGNNRCFANELAKDYSAAQGGREKLIPVEDGDDWGYPCCAAQNLPYLDECLACTTPGTEALDASTPICKVRNECSPKCETTKPESASFIIGDTPFGLDFIDNQFPPPWDHRVFVGVHGAFGSWAGARVVGVKFDPATGRVLAGGNLPLIDGGFDGGAMDDFLEGWDDLFNPRAHGRPTDVTVAPDGRLFISNDTNGEIFWVSPVGR
ncbi:MAG: hypothetical protein JNK82_12670 [Myxococcaceae bacterium]|nr:hypothetical protein [Myxococcaceae bacterium]